MQIGTSLALEIKVCLLKFLKNNGDVFAWSCEDMPDINPDIIVHRLNVDVSFKPVFQKRRVFNQERYVVIEEKVQKFLKVGFIQSVHYP